MAAEAAPVAAVGARHYAMYGLRVTCEIPLPFAPLASPDDGPPDLVIRHGRGQAPPPNGSLIASQPCAVHGMDSTVHRGSGGTRLWYRGIGTCYLLPGLRCIDLYAEAGADERALALLLAGPATITALQQRGCPVLHASAAVTDRGVAVFLGAHGQGKSTMLAAFLHRGATLLTDDALPLLVREGGIYGAPGLPLMKVWRGTAEHALALPDDLPDLLAASEKKLLTLDGRYPYARSPECLTAIYMLQRYDPNQAGTAIVELQQLGARDGITALLGQTSNHACLLAVDIARFLPLYTRLAAQAPLRVLRYPHGFAYQEAVHAAIMADLEAR